MSDEAASRCDLSAMLAMLDGLPTSRADEMPPGSVCGLCALQRHVFVHPCAIPGSHWSLMDGCPCCDTHFGPGTWPDDPPLGCAAKEDSP
jgi:hypothetical protein